MAISQADVNQLQHYVNSGNAAGYYNLLAQNSHLYGNLAYGAATDTGFWGQYANNFMELKAAEYCVTFDRNQVMLELMQADFNARQNAGWEPITADVIRGYHHVVFEQNGLPPAAWTGTFLDDRAGSAAWCMGCSNTEINGDSVLKAIERYVENLKNDFKGTTDEAYDFLTDALGDGVLSETMADWNYQTTGNLEWAAFVKSLYQTIGILFQVSLDISKLINDLFFNARNFTPPRRDPLTLDLDGDGIETIGANGTVLFDHDGDGVKNASGWIQSDDGLLVLDRNGNGTIDSGRELFGADTIKSNGQQASSGFDALKDLDSNNDNVFNASDAQFGNVRVWRDLNQDGISQSNELFTLASLNIKAINLVPASTADVDFGNGHFFARAA